jgi:Domain of unknown function (DUF4398)
MNKSAPIGRHHRLRCGLAAALIGGASALLVACATTPPPNEQVAVSTAALANAVSAGAPELAPVEMKTARDKLDRANVAMLAKNYDAALSLAQEAQVDAGVAQAKAQSIKAQKAADAVRDDSRALAEELDRKKAQAPAPRN